MEDMERVRGGYVVMAAELLARDDSRVELGRLAPRPVVILDRERQPMMLVESSRLAEMSEADITAEVLSVSTIESDEHEDLSIHWFDLGMVVERGQRIEIVGRTEVEYLELDFVSAGGDAVVLEALKALPGKEEKAPPRQYRCTSGHVISLAPPAWGIDCPLGDGGTITPDD